MKDQGKRDESSLVDLENVSTFVLGKGPRWRRCLPALWSIRSITSFCFLLSLVILGSMISLVGLIFGIRSISDVTSNNGLLVKTIVENYVEDWLGRGKLIIDGVERYMIFREDELDLSFRNHGPSVDHMQLFLVNFHQSFLNPIHVGLGTPHGVAVASNKSPMGYLACWSDETTMDNPCCNYDENHQPGPLLLRLVLPGNKFGPYFNNSNPFDYRMIENGWYPHTISKPNETYVWTTNLSTEKRLITTVCKRAFNSSGAMIGVIVVAFNFPDFNEFLTDLVTNKLKMGEIFVVDDSGYLLSNTLDSPVYKEIQGPLEVTQQIERLKPEESENSIISSVSKTVLAEYGDWSEVTATEDSFIFRNNRMISIVTPSVTGLSHIFVFSTTIYEVYHQAVNVGTVSVSVLIVVSLAFVTVCIVAVILVTQPLFRLVKQMKKIEKMDLDGISVKKTFLFEVRALQNAFMFTVEKLREFKAFLPMSLIGGEINVEEYVDEIEGIEDEPNENENEEPGGSRSSSERSDGSSEGSMGDTSSNVSESSTRGSRERVLESTFGVTSNPFALNLRQTDRFFMVITIVGVAEMLGIGDIVSRDAVIQFTSLFYELLNELATMYGGVLNEYSLEVFYVTFRKRASILTFFEPFMIKLNVILEKYPLLNAKIGIIVGKVWMGTIGSKKLRKRIVWGQNCNFLLDVLTKYKAKMKVDVLVGDWFAKLVPLRYITKPIMISEGYKGREFIAFYRLEKILEMYSLRSDPYFELRSLCRGFFDLTSAYFRFNTETNLVFDTKSIERDMQKNVKKHPKDFEISMFGFQLKTALAKVKEKFANKDKE